MLKFDKLDKIKYKLYQKVDKKKFFRALCLFYIHDSTFMTFMTTDRSRKLSSTVYRNVIAFIIINKKKFYSYFLNITRKNTNFFFVTSIIR